MAMNMTLKERLLTQVTPLAYDILLMPNLETFTFSGEETLIFTNKKPTKKIVLHASHLVIEKAVLVENGVEQEAKITYNKKEMSVSFEFAKTITAEKKQLKIAFTGIIGNKLRGWYKSTYIKSGETKYLATTQFEEIGAREVFPCIDDPMAKAVFTISVRIPENLTAISNTIDVATNKSNGLKTVQFAPTPKMATYALAFIVGEFEYIEKKTPSGVLVRVFVTPGKKSQAGFALDAAIKLLPFYEKYFGIAYPLPVLDLIAIPDFDAGAMENWGAITAREMALLVDAEQTSAANKQYVAIVVAHELTHMWFGNLVTMKWWEDLWLNEGFASYMEYVGVNFLHPEWNMWEQFAVLDHNKAMRLDSLENTHPIQAKIKNIEQITEIFDEVSYSKGASIIQMVVDFLGEESFQKGLQYYLKKYAYSNAETNDLWQALGKVSGKKVEDLMQTYTQKPGHPLVNARVSNDTMHLSQARFFSSIESREKSKDATAWQIPLHIASENKTTEFLLDKKEDSFPIDFSWIKLNKGETTFARVIYDAELIKRLEVPIKNKAISSIDRMGVVRDSFDAAEGGYAPVERALALVLHYTDESSYIVWASLAGKLNKIDNLLSETKLRIAYQAFVRKIFAKIGESVGWEKQASDSHEDILLRSVVLSSLGQYKDNSTIQKAKELFAKIEVDKSSVDTDIRGIVYAITAENGGREEFEKLKNMYIKETLSAEKNRIGNALCLFEDPSLVQRALDFSLSTHVRSQDIGRFIMSSFDNPKGREIAWKFVTKHWDILLEKMEGMGMDWMIQGAASIVSEELSDDIKEFFAKHPNPKLEKAMKQVVEQIESNLAWLKRDQDAIAAFLLDSK